MKPTFLFLCLIVLSSQYVAAQESLREKEKLVDEYIKQYESIGSYSGSILIMKDGIPLLNKGFGMANYEHKIPATPDTKYYLGSNSKIFTAVSILILEEQGLLKTEDVIEKYVSNFPSGNKITLHQLLTHTSGIAFDLPLFRDEASDVSIWEKRRTLDEQIELLRTLPLVSEPGTQVLYSNNNYRLLAYIIEQVSGNKFGEFVQKEIFRTCKMKNSGHDGTGEGVKKMATGYFLDGPTGLKESFKMDWSNKTGQASIYSTTGDMYKFYSTLFEGKLISHSSVKKMCTGYAKSKVGTYGYGLFVSEGDIYSFNGRSPGYSSEVRYYDREEKIFAVVLSNNYSAPVLRIMNNIMSIYLGGNYKDMVIGKPIAVTDEVLAPFEGTYKGGPDFVMPNVELEVRRERNTLIIVWKLSGGRESILIPQSENSFLDKTFWSTLRFEKNSDQRVERLVYTSFGKDYTAMRVN